MTRTRTLTRWLGIHPGEERVAFSLFFYLFAIIASYLLIKTAREGLFLSRYSALKLPYVVMGMAGATLTFLWAYLHLLRRFLLPRITLLTLAFFISNLGAFWFLAGQERGWLYFVIYIWSGLFGVIGPMQVWSLANHLLTTRQAKRLYGFIGAGGILGGIAGGFLAAGISKAFNTETLLLVMATGLGISMWLVFALTRRHPGLAVATVGESTDERETSRPGLIQSMRWISASRYLLLIMAVVILGRVVTGIVDYQFKATTREAMATTEDLADQLTAFFGYFYGYLGILSLGIQLLLTRRILERLGVLAALIMLPACYLLGSGVLFLLPGIAAATGMKGAGLLLKHSVARSSLELLYLPLSGQMKYATKSFIDTAVWRMSDGVGGIILLLFATILEWSPRMLVWVNLPLILGWILVSFMARKDYVGTLRASIRRRILNPEHVWVEWHEPETVQELRTSLKREKETELLHTLKIVEWAELKELSEPLQELTRHSSPRVRARALALLTSWEVPQAVRNAEALLTDEDLDVRTAAAHTISVLGRGPPQEKLRELLDHPVPGIRAAAVICLLQEPDGCEVEPCRRVLEEIVNLSGTENAPARRDVARTLGHRAAHKIGERLLPRLFEDPDMQVRRTAIQSAAHYTNPDWIPLFIVQLGIRRDRGAVLDTLAAYGPAVIPTLSPWLTEPAWPAEVRKRVAKLFGRLKSPGAFPPLIRALEDPQPEVRYLVLKSMARLHRSCPECPLPQPLLHSVLRREAEGAYLYLGGLQRVLSSPGSFADPVFLRWALKDRYEKALVRIFRLLGLIHPTKSIHQAFIMLRASQPIPRANAVEYLDQTLTGPTKALIMPLVTPELDIDARLQHGQRNFPTLSETYRRPWPELLEIPDTLLRICLLTSLGPQSDTIPPDRITALEREDNPLVRSAAQHALAQAGESPKESKAMSPLNVVQKLRALQLVDIFSQTDPEGLAHLATLAEEQHFRSEDIIYPEQGPPDAIYFLIDGGVELTLEGKGPVHRVEPYQAFGYLAILDREPRPFSARATEDSRVLRINADDFFDELADHSEIAQSFLGALGSRLRNFLLKASS